MLKERVEGADDIPARGHHVRGSAGELDKAFERVAEVTNAIEVMTQGMCFCARSDDEDVAGILSSFKSAIHQGPIDEAAKAQATRPGPA